MSHLLPFTAHVVSHGCLLHPHLPNSYWPQLVLTSLQSTCLSRHPSPFRPLTPGFQQWGGKNLHSLHSCQPNLLVPQKAYLAKCGRSPGHREVSFLTRVAQPEPHLPLLHTQSLHKHILNKGEKPGSVLGAWEQKTAKGPAVLPCLYTGSLTSPSACLSDGTEWELRARLREQNWHWLGPILPHA